MSHSEFGRRLRRIGFRSPDRRVTRSDPGSARHTVRNDAPSLRSVELLWTGPGIGDQQD